MLLGYCLIGNFNIIQNSCYNFLGRSLILILFSFPGVTTKICYYHLQPDISATTAVVVVPETSRLRSKHQTLTCGNQNTATRTQNV